MAGKATVAGRRGAPRATVAVMGVALGVAALVACSSEQAKACAEQSGATFCVRRQGAGGIEPTAEGLLPGSTLTYTVGGGPSSEPFTSPVGPTGVPDRGVTMGFVSVTGVADLRGATVEFAGTAADGSAVSVTLEVPG